MSGTVTHDVAQFLNNIVRPYLNTTYIVTSGTELLVQLENVSLQPQECLVSLDVELSLPSSHRHNRLLEIAYNYPTIAPPAIPFDQLRKLLIICTTKTPFSFDNQTYIQTDGVSMGSPLGSALADFFMENLEGNLLRQDRASNQKFYKRYVDDILAIFHKESHVNIFKQRFHRSSVLNFTHKKWLATLSISYI